MHHQHEHNCKWLLIGTHCPLHKGLLQARPSLVEKRALAVMQQRRLSHLHPAGRDFDVRFLPRLLLLQDLSCANAAAEVQARCSRSTCEDVLQFTKGST